MYIKNLSPMLIFNIMLYKETWQNLLLVTLTISMRCQLFKVLKTILNVSIATLRRGKNCVLYWTTRKSDGTQTKDAREYAATLKDILNQYILLKMYQPKITRYHHYEDIVLEKLSKLDFRKAQGPDCISSWILKYCREALCQPLTTVYQQSLESGNPQKIKLMLMSHHFLRKVNGI